MGRDAARSGTETGQRLKWEVRGENEQVGDWATFVHIAEMWVARYFIGWRRIV